MNDPSAHERRSAKALAKKPVERSTKTSRLNEFVVALKDLRLDGLDTLDAQEFEAFVLIGCDIFGHDAARLYLCRWLRDLEDERERAA